MERNPGALRMDEIARAYLVPAKTVSLPGAPGTPLMFSAGLCKIRDQRLVIAALRRADVTVQPEPRWESHISRWVEQCGEGHPARAKVALANGTVLQPPHYRTPEEELRDRYGTASGVLE